VSIDSVPFAIPANSCGDRFHPRYRPGIDRRRFLLTSLAGAFAPLAAEAQQPGRIPRVGVLANGTAKKSPSVDAFRQGLRDLGYVEGHNMALEIRRAEGRFERLPEMAAELVRWKPDVLVTAGPYGLYAARRATTTIPIVMITCDPAETVVEGVARPSGHITGVTCMSSDLTPKRLQLLKEAVPSIRRVAVLYNRFDPNKVEEIRQMHVVAHTLQIILQPVEAAEAEAFDGAIADGVRGQADGLFVLPDPLTMLEGQRIAALAVKHRLPSMYGFKEFVMAGGLMSYGTPQPDLYRRAAAHVDKVIRGAKPSDVPVEQATRFEFQSPGPHDPAVAAGAGGSGHRIADRRRFPLTSVAAAPLRGRALPRCGRAKAMPPARSAPDVGGPAPGQRQPPGPRGGPGAAAARGHVPTADEQEVEGD
jgi:putative ABC transport system substrate-binding protein